MNAMRRFWKTVSCRSWWIDQADSAVFRMIMAKDAVVAIIKGKLAQRARVVAQWIDDRAQIRTDDCHHAALKVVHAHVVKTRFAYSYWKALVRCRTCDEEWILQARTPGLLSSDPHSNIFRDSTI